MISKTALGHQQDLHPVIRTLYDHADVRCLPTCALWVFCYDGNMYNCALVKNVSTVQGVVALDFHPTVSVLASGSRDCKVKFFDYSKPSAKCSYCSIPEVATARCLVFHPSGDYMLVGTEQSTCTHQTSVCVYMLTHNTTSSSSHTQHMRTHTQHIDVCTHTQCNPFSLSLSHTHTHTRTQYVSMMSTHFSVMCHQMPGTSTGQQLHQ